MALKAYPTTLTTYDQTIYQAPIGFESSAHALVFSNPTSSVVTYSLKRYNALEDELYDLAINFPIQPYSVLAWPGPINMLQGDYLVASANINDRVVCEIAAYENPTYRTGFTPRGDWDITAQYYVNDLVVFEDLVWVCSQDNIGLDPSSNPSNWMEFILMRPDIVYLHDVQTISNKTVVGLKERKYVSVNNNFDLKSANYFTHTLTGNTTFTLSNVATGDDVSAFVLEITNGGAFNINWWGGIRWSGGAAPTLTPEGVDALAFYSYDGGSTWTCVVLGIDIR